MKCPVDGTELKMAERQGVEIDYCPQCRGVWLDRGELDKIIEKATPAVELDDPDPYLGTPVAPAREPRAEQHLERHREQYAEQYGEPRYNAPHRETRYEDRRDGRHDDGRENYREPRYDARGDEERDYDARRHDERSDRYEKRGKYDKRDKYYLKKKRKSFLKELFDVFD